MAACLNVSYHAKRLGAASPASQSAVFHMAGEAVPSRSLATQFVSPLYSIKTVGDKFELLRFKQRPVCILRVIGYVCDSGYDLGWEPFLPAPVPAAVRAQSVLSLPPPTNARMNFLHRSPPVALKKATPKSERESAAGAGA